VGDDLGVSLKLFPSFECSAIHHPLLGLFSCPHCDELSIPPSIYFISFLRLYGALDVGTIKLNDAAVKLGLDLIFLIINSHIFIFFICNFLLFSFNYFLFG
jgi:hypothetical protein